MMADTETDLLPNGTGTLSEEEVERMKQRPADIDADVREMERRKRVEALMSSKLFREELERVLDQQMHEGNDAPLLQRIREMVGGRLHTGSLRGPSCVLPINDIRGIEGVGYEKGEKILRCKLAAVYRLVDLFGWTQSGNSGQITARLNTAVEQVLTTPRGLLPHEVTASSLVKVDMQGVVQDQGTTNFPPNVDGFSLHASVHAARPDVRCVLHIRSPSALAVSSMRRGLLPLCSEAALVGDVAYHRVPYGILDNEERDKLVRALGPHSKILMLSSGGALCCGATLEEAFFQARNLTAACDVQLRLASLPLDELSLLDDDTRRQIYETSRKPPADQTKWRVGGEEFEALMRMLDNAGFRTGYIYRHPLIKNDVPKPKSDVEVPPAVSSLGYLLEEEELYRQGLWKKGQGKTGERTRWLNSPNVYQKVEVLETGTNDPKKITKWVDANNEEWVQDGSPAHSSTPVKIDTLQFVPKNTNPKEFKALQQQIKDNRRADKISAGPQSHILEGVTWDEASKLVGEDAQNTHTGDHVVLMGAASKGIIQRGYQHNATVYSAPYVRNPFDHVSDREIDDYRRIVERKQRGDYDTDLSESEAISAAQMTSPASQPSETEEESRDEHRVLRIETKHVPVRSQPEVVLSDVDTTDFLTAEREHADRTKATRGDVVSDGMLADTPLTPPVTSRVIIHQSVVKEVRDPHLLSDDEVFLDSPVTSQPSSAMTSPVPEQVVVKHFAVAQHSVVRGISGALTQALSASKRSLHDYSRSENFDSIVKKLNSPDDAVKADRAVKNVDLVDASCHVVSDRCDCVRKASNNVNEYSVMSLDRNLSKAQFVRNAIKFDVYDKTCPTADYAQNVVSDSRRVKVVYSDDRQLSITFNDDAMVSDGNSDRQPKCKMSLNSKLTEKMEPIELGTYSSRSSLFSIPSIDWDGRGRSEYTLRTRSLPRQKAHKANLYRTRSHSGFINSFVKDPEPLHFHLPRCRSCGAANTSYAWEVAREEKKKRIPTSVYLSVDNIHKKCHEEDAVKLKVTEKVVPVYQVEKDKVEFVESQEFTEDNYLGDIGDVGNSFSSENQTVIEKFAVAEIHSDTAVSENIKSVSEDTLKAEGRESNLTLVGTVNEDVYRPELALIVETNQSAESESTKEFDHKKPEILTNPVAYEEVKDTDRIEGEYHSFSDEMDFEQVTYISPVKELVGKDIRDYSVPIDCYYDEYMKNENSPTKSPMKKREAVKGNVLEPILEESKSSYDDSDNLSNDKPVECRDSTGSDKASESIIVTEQEGSLIKSETNLDNEEELHPGKRYDLNTNGLEYQNVAVEESKIFNVNEVFNLVENKMSIVEDSCLKSPQQNAFDIESGLRIPEVIANEGNTVDDGDTTGLLKSLGTVAVSSNENHNSIETRHVQVENSRFINPNDIIEQKETIETIIEIVQNVLSITLTAVELHSEITMSETRRVTVDELESECMHKDSYLLADEDDMTTNDIDCLSVSAVQTAMDFYALEEENDDNDELVIQDTEVLKDKMLECFYDNVFEILSSDAVVNDGDDLCHKDMLHEEIASENSTGIDNNTECIKARDVDNFVANKVSNKSVLGISLLKGVNNKITDVGYRQCADLSKEVDIQVQNTTKGMLENNLRENDVSLYDVNKEKEILCLIVDENETPLSENAAVDRFYNDCSKNFRVSGDSSGLEPKSFDSTLEFEKYEVIMDILTNVLNRVESVEKNFDLLQNLPKKRGHHFERKDDNIGDNSTWTPDVCHHSDINNDSEIPVSVDHPDAHLQNNGDDLDDEIITDCNVVVQNEPMDIKTDETTKFNRRTEFYCHYDNNHDRNRTPQDVGDFSFAKIVENLPKIDLNETVLTEFSEDYSESHRIVEAVLYYLFDQVCFTLIDKHKDSKMRNKKKVVTVVDTEDILYTAMNLWSETNFESLNVKNIVDANEDCSVRIEKEASNDNSVEDKQNLIFAYEPKKSDYVADTQSANDVLETINSSQDIQFPQDFSMDITSHDENFNNDSYCPADIENFQDVSNDNVYSCRNKNESFDENDTYIFDYVSENLDNTLEDFQNSRYVVSSIIQDILEQSVYPSSDLTRSKFDETFTVPPTDMNTAFLETHDDYYSRSSSPIHNSSILEVCTESPIRNTNDSFMGEDLSVLYDKDDMILGSPFVKKVPVISMSHSAHSGGIKYWVSFDESLTDALEKPRPIRKTERKHPSFITFDLKDEHEDDLKEDSYWPKATGLEKRRSSVLLDNPDNSKESFVSACGSVEYTTCSSPTHNDEPIKKLLYDSRLDLHTKSNTRRYASWPPFEDTIFYRIISKFRMSESFDPSDFENIQFDENLE